jgi:hypothetical protein
MTTEWAATEVNFSECKPESHKSHEKPFKSMKIKKHSFIMKSFNILNYTPEHLIGR